MKHTNRRGESEAGEPNPVREVPLHRRDFLRRGTLAAMAVGAAGALGLRGTDARAQAAKEAGKPARVRRYKMLGKTDIRMPDISIGTGTTASPKIIRYAFNRGMTYFDTAEGYPMTKPGQAEKAIAVALRGKRNEVALASKQITKASDDRQIMMKRLDASLRRLRTDRIDVYFNHAVNDVARMKNPEWGEFIARAKKQGKIRYSGMSGHGGHLLECLDYSLDNDLVDVILTAYNFGQDPKFYERFTKSFDFVANQQGLTRVLAKAHAKGVGTIAMKTLMGGRLNDMRPYETAGGTYSQAAFRWVLSNPDVDALIVSMTSNEQIDEFLAASGTSKLQANDVHLMSKYAELNGTSQCRQGCGDCSGSCPHGVPIEDVLRARMYANDYGQQGHGRASYAALGAGASPCLACSGEPCANACSWGLDIPGLTRSTPGILGLA